MYVWSTNIAICRFQFIEQKHFPDSYKMNAVTNVNVTKLCWTTRDAAKFNKKNTKSKYADKYQKTFEKLKVILTNSETITYFISDGQTKVIAEA